MRKRVLRAVIVAATTGVGVGLLTPIAAHANVQCGQTITASMTLTHHLHCPAGNGININANNVVLDLGGHSISGAAPTGGNRRGVNVTFDHHGAVIRNGIIRGFDTGVLLGGRADATISGLILDGNGSGIITQTDSSGSRITGNTIVNTTQFSGIQLGGNGHLVADNTLNNGGGSGIIASGSNNVIRDNKVNGAGASGIAITTFPSNPGPFLNNQITGNQVVGSSRVFTSSSISVGNGRGTLVHDNAVTGRRTTPGVFVIDSADTVVSENTLVNHSTGVLIRGASTGTRVTGNQATLSTFSGIAVESVPTGTVVADNVTSSNSGNGINVSNAATTITRNLSFRNTGLGIFAVNGVTDGGGNRAFANGNPAQCSPSIVCTT